MTDPRVRVRVGRADDGRARTFVRPTVVPVRRETFIPLGNGARKRACLPTD